MRQIAAKEFALRVKLLALADRVEDAKVGLGVAAAGAGPLPAAIVGREVEVDEMRGKVGLAPAPVQPQVFHEEAGHHHAQAVMHVARLVDLGHGGIHQRIASAAFTPGGKKRLRVRSFFPLDRVIGRLETAAHHMGVVVENLKVKVPPDQLAEPGGGTLVSRLREPMCGACQQARRDRAKAQVHAQITGPFHRRKIACLVVVLDAAQKIVQQLLRATGAGGQRRVRQGCVIKAQRRQRWHGLTVRLRAWCQAMRMALHGVAFELKVIHLFQPRVLVGRKDAVGAARLRQHLAALQHGMVFVGVERTPLGGQPRAHPCVAGERLRFVVMVGKNGLHVQRLGQRRNRIAGDRVKHYEPPLRVA